MKGTHFTIDGSQVFIDGPDAFDQIIRVNGKVWRFNYDKMFGPLWLKADGEPRKCQFPSRAVWAQFQKWQKRYNKVNR